jgi:hypothetical protein
MPTTESPQANIRLAITLCRDIRHILASRNFPSKNLQERVRKAIERVSQTEEEIENLEVGA